MDELVIGVSDLGDIMIGLRGIDPTYHVPVIYKQVYLRSAKGWSEGGPGFFFLNLSPITLLIISITLFFGLKILLTKRASRR